MSLLTNVAPETDGPEPTGGTSHQPAPITHQFGLGPGTDTKLKSLRACFRQDEQAVDQRHQPLRQSQAHSAGTEIGRKRKPVIVHYDPDSGRRERRYRLRDKAEWIEVDMPDLRIVDEELASRVADEVASRRRKPGERTTGASNRAKHLLSGLIRCGSCGAKHVLTGKDYYRCARNRERGTCSDATTVRLAAVEEAVLSALQSQLLTPDLVELFTEEFAKEVERLTRTRGEPNEEARVPLKVLDVEIGNLAAHFLAGSVSPTLSTMLAEREDEKARLEAQLAADVPDAPTVMPHPSLVRRYEAKVPGMREAINDDLVRADAIAALRSLIGSVTVHRDESGRTVLEVEASTAALIDFAQTTTPRGQGLRGVR